MGIQRSSALSLSRSRCWIGICYLAGSSWQICFEYIIYPVLCSWVFVFPFPLMHQPPGQSSPPRAKLRLLGDYLQRSSTLLPLAWTPSSKFLVRADLPPSKKPLLDYPRLLCKKKPTPEDSDKLKKNEAHMCHPELVWRAVRPRECQIELGKVKQSRIHPDFWSVSHNYRGKWCVLPLLHTAHTH